MKYSIYVDGHFSGHTGNEKNMQELARIIIRKNPKKRIQVIKSLSQDHADFVTRY